MLIFYLLVLSLPLTEHWLLSKDVGGLTVEKLLGLLCIPFAISHLLSTKRIVAPLPTTVKAFTAYFLLLMTQSIFLIDLCV